MRKLKERERESARLASIPGREGGTCKHIVERAACKYTVEHVQTQGAHADVESTCRHREHIIQITCTHREHIKEDP